jgi:nucleotide-binding universal stress UspA family protein
MYARILVPVDGSEAAARGLNEGIKLAQDLKAHVRLVHVVEPWVMVSMDTMAVNAHQIADHIRSIGAELLKECEATAAKAGIKVDTELVEKIGGTAGEHIVRKAKEFNADLIVCGTHGRRGIRRLLMGSDAEYIVRRTPVPVLLVRTREATDLEDD